MTAPHRAGFSDPVDRPDAHAPGNTTTTVQQRAAARLTVALAGHDRTERRQLLDMLGLLDRTEIYTQLAHHTKEAA